MTRPLLTGGEARRRPVAVAIARRGVVLLSMAAALLAGAARPALAQDGSVQGIVTSAATGSPLEGVAVVLLAGESQAHAVLTDRNGFYQVGGVDPGAYSLEARLLGFRTYEQQLDMDAGDRRTVNVRLEEDPVALEELVVSASRGATVRELGRQRVTPAELRLVPVPAGSGDLATYLQTLPGVTTTGDRGGQLFVRGGTPSENLVLVDGFPIYQPFHIVGFFSVFPEDLVSGVDFYAGGFGPRYSGRTSSVLDVALRDGNPGEVQGSGSVSPFLAEALVEGPLGDGVSLIAAARRSLVDETSEPLLGARQPLTFDSQLLKLTIREGDNLRCSALALRTSDRGQLDPEEDASRVAWRNLVLGGRCVSQFESFLRLFEANFSYSSVANEAVSRGSSDFESSIWRLQHDAHATTLLGTVPLRAGYHFYTELSSYDLRELFGFQLEDDELIGAGAYLEPTLRVGDRLEVRPGVHLAISPRRTVEPRVRASWQPLGRPEERLEAAVGLYSQDLLGTSDMRDVGSVFTAWMRPPGDRSTRALHGIVGWQQALGGGVRWSVDGYYKWLRDLPVPIWRAVAQFTTRLGRAEGEVYGADLRLEVNRPGIYGFVGYGYAVTEYVAAADDFDTWFGERVQRFHPPHDRRHQVNALATVDVADFELSARWQLGSGLPFTRPMGFDEAFNFGDDLHDVSRDVGTTRLLLDRPFAGRLPMMHRLDLSLGRTVRTRAGRLSGQVGVINAYDRRNMFYYDLYSGRRVDQLPLAPYASLTLRTR